MLVPIRSLVWAAALLSAAHPPATTTRPDDTFGGLMQSAMHRMHAGMDVDSTGDPDRDFAQMMIPHHQGAVDMALIELRYGRDPRLRRLAQAIVVEQRSEIELMRLYLEKPLRAEVLR